MTVSPSTYAVGRGKPPQHTRFQKGQSGNPSGKPGPARLARQRFHRALCAALQGSPEELELANPDNVIAAVARKIALDAADGRIAAVRLVLSVLDAESRASVSLEDHAAEQLFTGAEILTLLQGKTQGNDKQWLEDLLWPEADERATEVPPPPCGEVEKRVCARAINAPHSRAFFGWGPGVATDDPHPKFAPLRSQISTSPQGELSG